MTLLVLAGGLVALVALVAVVIRAMHGVARAATLALIVLVAVAVAGWIGLGQEVRWEEAAQNGDTDTQLVIAYFGGECEDHRSASVDETDSAVIITVTTRTLPTACSDIGVRHTVIAQLDRPLGDRVLLDGACDRPRSCQRTLVD